jgi:hypothetical protein
VIQRREGWGEASSAREGTEIWYGLRVGALNAARGPKAARERWGGGEVLKSNEFIQEMMRDEKYENRDHFVLFVDQALPSKAAPYLYYSTET